MESTEMNNPIPRSSLFVTPESMTDLDQMIQQLPATERATVYQYVMFAFNLAHKLVEESKENV
jgi:hypothetical protein